MKLHHIGCLVESIEEAIAEYKIIHQDDLSYTPTLKIDSQKVSVSFLDISSNVLIELVEPYPDNLGLTKMLKKNQSFYHIGYMTDNFDTDSARFVEQGLRKLPDFESAAFDYRRCAFFVNKLGHLIELIEGPTNHGN